MIATLNSFTLSPSLSELAECFGNCCHYDQPQQDPSWRRTMPPETPYQRQIKRFTRLSQNSKTPEKSSRLRTRRNGFFEPRKPSQRQSLNIEGLLVRCSGSDCTFITSCVIRPRTRKIIGMPSLPTIRQVAAVQRARKKIPRSLIWRSKSAKN